MKEFEITVNDSRFQEHFRKLINKGENTRPLLKQMGAIIQDAIDENFEKQGRPGKWDALSPKTVKERQKHNYNGPILQRTGTLKNSFTRRVTDAYVWVGTTIEYAAIHNFGGLCGRNHSVDMPQREFTTLTSLDIDDLAECAKNYLDDIK